MGFESQPIIKNTAVDNVTLETNVNGEIQVKGGAVSSNLISADAVTTTKILNNAVTSAKLNLNYDYLKIGTYKQYSLSSTALSVGTGLIYTYNSYYTLLKKMTFSNTISSLVRFGTNAYMEGASWYGSIELRKNNTVLQTITFNNTVSQLKLFTDISVSQNDVIEIYYKSNTQNIMTSVQNYGIYGTETSLVIKNESDYI